MTITGTKTNEKDSVVAGGDFKKTDAQHTLKDQTLEPVQVKSGKSTVGELQAGADCASLWEE